MRGKTHSSKLSLIVLFLCIFAFWWGIAVLSQTAQTGSKASSSAAPLVASSQHGTGGVTGPVAVAVAVSNNMYTYSGSVPLRSSCEQLGEGIAVSGQNPEHATIVLSIISPTTACAQAAGSHSNNEPFSVSVSTRPGSKAVLDGLTINGIIVPITTLGSK